MLEAKFLLLQIKGSFNGAEPSEAQNFAEGHQIFIKSPPTMWWRLIDLVLSIVVIIIIQQFDDMNVLQSQIFI